MIKLDVFLIKDFDGNIIANFTIERKALDFVHNKRNLTIEHITVSANKPVKRTVPSWIHTKSIRDSERVVEGLRAEIERLKSQLQEERATVVEKVDTLVKLAKSQQQVKVLNWKEVLYNHITSVLDSNSGNKALTARQLGMSVTNLTHRLKQFATIFGE